MSPPHPTTLNASLKLNRFQEIDQRRVELQRILQHTVNDIWPGREIRPNTELLSYPQILRPLPGLFVRFHLKHVLSAARYRAMQSAKSLNHSYCVFQYFHPSMIANYNHDGPSMHHCQIGGAVHRYTYWHATIPICEGCVIHVSATLGLRLSRAFLVDQDGVIAVLKAYMDESGTHAGSPVVTVGRATGLLAAASFPFLPGMGSSFSFCPSISFR